MKRILKKDLEAKVKELESDLRELVLNPNSNRSMLIDFSIRLDKMQEDAIMLGNAGVEFRNTGGIERFVKENPTGEYGPITQADLETVSLSDQFKAQIPAFEDICIKYFLNYFTLQCNFLSSKSAKYGHTCETIIIKYPDYIAFRTLFGSEESGTEVVTAIHISEDDKKVIHSMLDHFEKSRKAYLDSHLNIPKNL